MMKKENVSAVNKKLSFCLKGNRFTGVSEESFSVALKGFVPNTARYNERVFNFESWRSQLRSLFHMMFVD